MLQLKILLSVLALGGPLLRMTLGPTIGVDAGVVADAGVVGDGGARVLLHDGGAIPSGQCWSWIHDGCILTTCCGASCTDTPSGCPTNPSPPFQIPATAVCDAGC
jgi:hypothetical protein